MTRVTCASCPETRHIERHDLPRVAATGKVEPAAYQPPNGLDPVMVLMRLGPCLEQGRKPVEDGD